MVHLKTRIRYEDITKKSSNSWISWLNAQMLYIPLCVKMLTFESLVFEFDVVSVSKRTCG